MGKGRKPIPNQIKKLRGTNQPVRMKEEINLISVDKLPSVPRWFSKTQRRIYKTKGEQLRLLKLLSPLDIELFISFCREYGNYIDTSIELEKIPITASLSEASNEVFKRMSKINKEAWERSKAIGSEFGFSPVSRMKFVSQNNDEGQDYGFD